MHEPEHRTNHSDEWGLPRKDDLNSGHSSEEEEFTKEASLTPEHSAAITAVTSWLERTIADRDSHTFEIAVKAFLAVSGDESSALLSEKLRSVSDVGFLTEVFVVFDEDMVLSLDQELRSRLSAQDWMVVLKKHEGTGSDLSITELLSRKIFLHEVLKIENSDSKLLLELIEKHFKNNDNIEKLFETFPNYGFINYQELNSIASELQPHQKPTLFELLCRLAKVVIKEEPKTDQEDITAKEDAWYRMCFSFIETRDRGYRTLPINCDAQAMLTSYRPEGKLAATVKKMMEEDPRLYAFVRDVFISGNFSNPDATVIKGFYTTLFSSEMTSLRRLAALNQLVSDGDMGTITQYENQLLGSIFSMNMTKKQKRHSLIEVMSYNDDRFMETLESIVKKDQSTLTHEELNIKVLVTRFFSEFASTLEPEQGDELSWNPDEKRKKLTIQELKTNTTFLSRFLHAAGVLSGVNWDTVNTWQDLISQ